mmetsp:Transcript_62827/g.149858  ORF Transcript_62827/g.149858 Transcript_62827/m.149858 type:complete len:123 (+) Transcript_62827:99-467(+)|eukprot:CAMPEP_0178430926 /NCGR_PEP_ID=MMETSP0689_2-20121128/31572_1 /TAXON_ID=160604 /ORGANISM="Amphidinium massartii, Strain CS-259" /LENGTH=122 /DNA_ID=CAMNT_0020052799 /DNA_START=99 /DNA_END=467 /DNA_ORIENTATION=-
MAIRRSRTLGAVLLLAAAALTFSSTSFVPPAQEKSKAVDAATVLSAGLALTAAAPEVQAATGPLTGTAACQKPLAYLIYPLCDPIFLISPLYMGPILVVFWGTVVTTINLLIPATQPDEDLR